MNDVATLAWLEWRQFVNLMRESIRKPGRLIVALLAIAYLGFMYWVRTFASRPSAVRLGVPEPIASAIALLLVVLLGVTLYFTDAGFVRGFTSQADARFLIGSKLPERLVVLWVQLRTTYATVLRTIWIVLVYVFVFHTAGTALGIALSATAGFALTAALPIPMLKLDAASHVRITRFAAIVLIVGGGIPLLVVAAGWFAPQFAAWTSPIVHGGLGHTVNALLAASPLPIAILYVILALLFVANYLLGTDVYPELYLASTRTLRLYESQRRRGVLTLATDRDRRAKHEYRPPALFARFSGAWSLVWRDATAFGRSQQQRTQFIAGLAIAILIGGGIGVAAHRSSDPLELTISLGASIVNAYVILATFGTSVSLADDLRKPLFWLCSDPLRVRLYAWTSSVSWRPSVIFFAGICAWAFASRTSAVAWFGIPIAVAIVALLRSIGLALYSIFPGRIDQRGPLAVVRMILTYLLIAPAFGIAIAVGAFGDPPLGTAAGVGIALLEALVLIEMASRRIEGRGAAIAQAEGE